MHTEIYKIKGREYRYQVANYRVGYKVRHKKEYLGPVEPVHEMQRKKSTGRRPFVFVRKLTDTERKELEEAARSSKVFTRERAKAILYSADGAKVSKICSDLKREQRSILLTIHEFNKKGMACLKRGKTTGRKPKFTAEQKAKIVEILNTDPRKLGRNFTTWSLPKLRHYALEEKIVGSISMETVRQILRQGNKRYKKSRKWLYSNDPDFAKKNSELMN